MSSTHRVLQPLVEPMGSAFAILRFFGETPKTEADFARRFAALSPGQAAILSGFYDAPTPDALFRLICMFWNVPIVRDKQPICPKTKDP